MAIEIPAMKKIASLLDCSICFETLTDPVLLCSNQHTVDRACALQWLSKNPSCPECREAIDPTKPLNSNRLVVQLLDVYGNMNSSDLQQQNPEAPEVEVPSHPSTNEPEGSPDPASLIPSAPPFEPDELPSLKTNAEPQETSTVLKVVANSDRMNIAPKKAESHPLEDRPLPPTIRLSFAFNGNSGFILFSSSVCQQISERTAIQAGINFQKIVDHLDKKFIAGSNPLRKCQTIEAELKQRPHDPSSQKKTGYFMKCLNEGQYVLNKDKTIVKVLLNFRYVETLSGKKTALPAHTTINNSDGFHQLDEESFSRTLEQYHQKGLPWLKSSASSGNIEAQFCLGFVYANGKGVPRSLPMAIEWYQKAADQGLIDAQNNLKVIKEHYRVMSQELEQAYTQKVIQVLQYAKNNMSGRYAYQPNGLDTDYGYLNLNQDSLLKIDIPLAQQHGLIDQIISRLQLVVDQNGVSNKVDLDKLVNLILLSNKRETFGWILQVTLTSLQLNPKYLSQYLFKIVVSMKNELDECIVKYSYQNAFKWYEKQAKRNNAEALYIVGKMLYKGQGVDVNYVTARESWKKAANLGHAKAKEELLVHKV